MEVLNWIFVLLTLTATMAVIAIQPASTSTLLTKGDNYTLRCSAHNKTLGAMQWEFNGNVMFQDHQVRPDFTLFNNIEINDVKSANERTYNLKLYNVHLRNDGNYSCYYTVNKLSVERITVQAPPEKPFMRVISKVKINENDAIELWCSTDGANPNPDFFWYKGTDRIQSKPPYKILPPEYPLNKGGNSKSKLQFVSNWQDNGATYRCQVRNTVNLVNPVSSSLTLNVRHKPRVNLNSFRVIQGQPYSLVCGVKANPPAVITKWYKDNKIFSTSSITSINRTVAEKSHTGVYTCEAGNMLGVTNSSATLDVLYTPVITLDSTRTVTEGQTLVVQCVYDSNPRAISVQWLRHGAVYTRGNKLSVQAIKRKDAGLYTCEVTNEMDPTVGKRRREVVTKSVNITVKYTPGVSYINPVSSINIGDDVQLNCLTEDRGHPEAVFEWRKTGSRRVIGSDNVYNIMQAKLGDEGQYECLLRNELGTGAPAVVTVTVNVPPRITASSDPTTTVNITQRAVFLSCEAIGKPEPAITWYHGVSDTLPSGFFKTFVKSSMNSHDETSIVTSKLIFSGNSRRFGELIGPVPNKFVDYPGDAGNYTCVARSTSHDLGNLRTIRLIVRFPPVVIIPLKRFAKLAAHLSSPARLTCRIYSVPPPTSITWTRDHAQIVSSDKYRITNEIVSEPDVYRRDLSVVAVGEGDYGSYRCVCENLMGNGSASVLIVKPTVPDPPKGLKIYNYSWDYIFVHWVARFDGGFRQRFSVLVANVNMKATRHETNSTHYNITGLRPREIYHVTVIAVNERGESEPSLSITEVTSDLKIPAASNVTFTGKDNTLRIRRRAGYVPRVEYLIKGDKSWVLYRGSVVGARYWLITLPGGEGIQEIRVKLCLVHRADVCSNTTYAQIVANDPSPSSSLSDTQVIIVAVVCSVIIIVLLIILVIVYCKWKRQKPPPNRNFENESNRGRPQALALPQSRSRQLYDYPDPSTDKPPLHNDGIAHISNGPPPLYNDVVHNTPLHNASLHNNSYDSQGSARKATGVELNVINRGYHDEPIDLLKPSLFYNKALYPEMDGEGPPLYSPVKEPPQLQHTGSFTGQPESGYSTPEPGKPKKVIYEVVV